jgi:hypothetical protein
MKGIILFSILLFSGSCLVAQNLFPFQNKAGKYGYKNANGQVMIQPKYDNADYFNCGVATVSNGGEYGIGGWRGIIDTKGKELMKLTDKFDYINRFVEDYAKVDYPGATGGCNFINKSGKEISSVRFKEAMPFCEGMAAVKSDAGWGFIDTSGRLVIAFQYYDVTLFSGGIALVSGKQKSYINKIGKEILACKYDHAGNFSEGLAAVGMGGSQSGGGQWGYIDIEGNIAIPLNYQLTKDISNSLAVAMKGGKYGALNKKGEIVIPFRFDNIWPFQEGMAVAWLNGKCGFIDNKGATVVPFKYDGVGAGIEGFAEGMASVQIVDKYGFVDKTGKLVIPALYDQVWSFNQGRASVSIGEKEFTINRKGQRIE